MIENTMMILLGLVLSFFGIAGTFGFSKMLQRDLFWTRVEKRDTASRLYILTGDVMVLLIAVLSLVVGVCFIAFEAGVLKI